MPDPSDSLPLLSRAVDAAARWHAGHTRKGTAVPYVSHLLHVAALVLEHGGDDEQAAAAVLHDAVEDTEATLEEVAARFGPRVARIVEDCTDTLPGDTPGRKSPWEARKRHHLDRMAHLDEASALVVACDKRHNLESLVVDLETDGRGATAGRFSSAPEQWVWYYGEALERLRDRIPARLARELAALTAELGRLVALEGPAPD